MLAKYEDGVWYRGLVEEKLTSSNSLKVTFVDYGNTEVVSCKDVVKGKPEYFEVESLATKFILADIEATNGCNWNQDEIDKIENAIHGMEFTASVVSVGSAGIATTVTLTSSSGTAIVDGLIQQGCGKKSSNSYTKFQAIPTCKLSPGKQYHVYVSYLTSAMKFWVQLASFTDHIERMDTSLMEYVENGLPNLRDFKQGMPCVAKYEDAYYRGVIQSTNEKTNTSQIFFVDYGNSAEISSDVIYILPREEGFQHAMCAECSCKGDGVFDDVRSYVDSENAYIKVLSVLDSNAYVVEFVGNVKELDSPARPITNQSPNMSKSSPAAVMKFDPIQVDQTKPHAVCISNVENNGTFYCQLLHNAQQLESLMCNIIENKSTSSISGTLKSGMPCIASESTGLDYRGEVVENSVSGIRVKLVDFGNIQVFSQNDLHPISPEFARMPAQAFHCILKGSESYDKQIVFNMLKSYESQQQLNGIVRGVDESGLYILDLYDIFKDGVSLEKLLATAISQQQTSTLNPKTSAFLPQPDVSKIEDVHSVVVLSQSEIFCQLAKYSQDALDEFQINLANNYHQMDTVADVKPGDVCCTLFSGDGGTYRAKVTDIVGNGKVKVSLVDYGDTDVISMDKLKVLGPQFCNFPIQGIACCLRHSYPSITKTVLEKILEQDMTIQVLEKEGTKFHVAIPECEMNRHVLKVLTRSVVFLYIYTFQQKFY